MRSRAEAALEREPASCCSRTSTTAAPCSSTTALAIAVRCLNEPLSMRPQRAPARSTSTADVDDVIELADGSIVGAIGRPGRRRFSARRPALPARAACPHGVRPRARPRSSRHDFEPMAEQRGSRACARSSAAARSTAGTSSRDPAASRDREAPVPSCVLPARMKRLAGTLDIVRAWPGQRRFRSGRSNDSWRHATGECARSPATPRVTCRHYRRARSRR